MEDVFHLFLPRRICNSIYRAHSALLPDHTKYMTRKARRGGSGLWLGSATSSKVKMHPIKSIFERGLNDLIIGHSSSQESLG